MTLDGDAVAVTVGDLQLIDLGHALDRLAEIDAGAARLVELKFYVGLSLEEIAEVLDMGRATVARRWRYARSWLLDSLAAGA